MTTQKQDGGPAFPVPVIGDPKNYYPMDTNLPVTQTGLTMRDWFAGKALNVVLLEPGQYGNAANGNPERAADWAYQFADAMIAERNRRDTP